MTNLLRRLCSLFVVLSYVLLFISEMSWNEIEEEFNSSVQRELRVDFDKDGQMDLDLEDDEDSSDNSSSAKKSMDKICPQKLTLLETPDLNPQRNLLEKLRPQSDLTKIFIPPKA